MKKMKIKIFEQKNCDFHSKKKEEKGQNQQNRNFPKKGFGSTYTP